MDSQVSSLNQTEQLIAGMMSFLGDSDEDVQEENSEQEKNPLCWAIKRIINVLREQPTANEFPSFEQQRDPLGKLTYNSKAENQFEKACRYKDPYMQEVNRLMTSSAVGHPPEGSPEYYQIAENYALFGKKFLDFPTDLKFSHTLDASTFVDTPTLPTSLAKLPSSLMFGIPTGNRVKTLTPPPSHQQQIFVNQTNYCSYPLFQTQNLIQPLIYSNPIVMSQYFNAIMKESQMNASLVQQTLLTGAGVQERWLYAQMLQQQIQANQTALMNSCFGSGYGSSAAKNKHEAVKSGSALSAGEPNAASLKSDSNGGGECESLIVE